MFSLIIHVRSSFNNVLKGKSNIYVKFFHIADFFFIISVLHHVSIQFIHSFYHCSIASLSSSSSCCYICCLSFDKLIQIHGLNYVAWGAGNDWGECLCKIYDRFISFLLHCRRLRHRPMNGYAFPALLAGVWDWNLRLVVE